MSYRDKIIEIAISQIGYKEGHNNDTKYGDWYGLPNQPWCAMFVSWCANQAGIPDNIIKPFASCTAGFNWFKSQGLATREHISPEKGDIIFFKWQDDGTPDHVGLVEYVDGNTVHTIEGNRSDRVGRFTYNINASEIYGYATPNYNEDEIPEPSPEPSGDDTIRDIQRWCNNNYGTGIAEDGLYGPQTKKALTKALQTELNKQFNAGLNVDGIFGNLTRNACVNVRKGAQGNITKALQGMLICKGYDTNGFDGIFGSGTDNAVRQFQRDNGLSADGIAGKETFAKLFG